METADSQTELLRSSEDLIDALVHDLKAFARDAGRALPAVKEAANIAVNLLTTKRSQFVEITRIKLLRVNKVHSVGNVEDEEQDDDGAVKLEDVIRPFILVCNHKNVDGKLIVAAFSAIQKLLHADVLNNEERTQVMHTLRIQLQRNKFSEQIEVKSLQTLPLLLRPGYCAVQIDLLINALDVCCLYYGFNPGLASVTVRQIVSELFEQVESDIQSETIRNNTKAKVNRETALKLLEALVTVVALPSVCPDIPKNLTEEASSKSKWSRGNVFDLHPSEDFFVQPFSGSSSSKSPSIHPRPVSGASFNDRKDGYEFVHAMPKTLALDLIENILRSHSAIFCSDLSEAVEYKDFLQKRLFPVLSKSFGGRCDWVLMLHLVQIIVILVENLSQALSYGNVTDFVNILLQNLDDGTGDGEQYVRYVTPLWHRLLTVQALAALCHNLNLLVQPKSSPGKNDAAAPRLTDSKSGSRFTKFEIEPDEIVTKVVRGLAKVILGMVGLPEVSKGIDELAASGARMRDFLGAENPPKNLSESVVAFFAAECLANLSDSIAVLLYKIAANESAVDGTDYFDDDDKKSSKPLVGMELESDEVNLSGILDGNTASQDLSTSAKHFPKSFALNMISSCWKPLLGTLSILLHRCDNENVVQFLLKAYLSITNTCGILELEEPRDAFITSLCRIALPGWSPHMSRDRLFRPRDIWDAIENNETYRKDDMIPGSYFRAKEIQALKTVFSIAHGLGSILGSSWVILLEAFEHLDHIMYSVSLKKKLNQVSLANSPSRGPACENGINAAGGTKDASDWILVDDEILMLESMLDSLFSSSVNLDDAALLDIHTALAQESFTVLANIETSGKGVSQAAHAKRVEIMESRSARPESNWFRNTVATISSSLHDTISSVGFQDEAAKKDNNESYLPVADTMITQDLWYDEDISPLSSGSSSQRKPLRTERSIRKSALTVASGSYRVNESDSVKRSGINDRKYGNDILSRVAHRSPPFCILKLVETTKLNLFRLAKIWNMTQSVLTTAASKSTFDTRLYGVQAMEGIVIAAFLGGEDVDMLGNTKPADGHNDTSSQKKTKKTISNDKDYPKGKLPSNSTAIQATALVSNGMESELLEGFSQLLRSSYSDTREAAMQSLHRVVGTCGHNLNDGWSCVIRELILIAGVDKERDSDSSQMFKQHEGAKPTAHDQSSSDLLRKEHVKLMSHAFRVVQLIVDDFIQDISKENLRYMSQCILAYGQQKVLVNASLSAVAMLWQLCDNFRRGVSSSSSGLEKLSNKDSSVCEEITGVNLKHEQEGSAKNWDNSIIFDVFVQLKVLSVDERSEVRNCAIRTLGSVVSSCAPVLTEESWYACSTEIIMPLLEEIRFRSEKAPMKPVHGEILGRISGERALIHHSLDTVEKQWRETLITAVQATTRTIKSTVQHSRSVDWVLDQWRAVVNSIVSLLMTKPDVKVAVASCRCLHELVALTVGSVKVRYATVGMKVVDGALVSVDSNGRTRRASESLQHAECLPVPDGTPLNDMWEVVWAGYDSITAPTQEKDGKDLTNADDDTRHVASLRTVLAGVNDVDVATEIASGIGDLYQAWEVNSSELLRKPENGFKCLNVLLRLLAAFPADSEHATSLERAVLGAFSAISSVHKLVWPHLMSALSSCLDKDFKRKRSIDFTSSIEKLLVSVLEQLPATHLLPVFSRVTQGLLNFPDHETSELSDLHKNRMPGASVEREDKNSDATIKHIFEILNASSAKVVLCLGIRSVSDGSLQLSTTKVLWMNLLSAVASIVDQGIVSGEEETDGASFTVQEVHDLLDTVFERVEFLSQKGFVDNDICISLSGLLRTASRQTASPTISRDCVLHIIRLYRLHSNEDDLSVEDFVEILERSYERLVDFCIKEPPNECEELMECILQATLDLDVTLPNNALNMPCLAHLNVANLRLMGKKWFLLSIFPSLVRLMKVKSNRIVPVLEQIITKISESCFFKTDPNA